MHRVETHVEQVTFPEKFFKKSFIIRPDACNGGISWRNERVHAFLKKYSKYRFNGAGRRVTQTLTITGQ